MQQQQPGTVTHSRISSLRISRRLTRPRVASRYPVWTATWPKVDVAILNFGCASRWTPLSKFLDPPLWHNSGREGHLTKTFESVQPSLPAGETSYHMHSMYLSCSHYYVTGPAPCSSPGSFTVCIFVLYCSSHTIPIAIGTYFCGGSMLHLCMSVRLISVWYSHYFINIETVTRQKA